MTQLVRVPEIVRQRAWECAWVLREEYDDRLSLQHRIRCEVVRRSGPDSVGWEDAAAMFVLFGQIVEVRV